ncbi:hypothetical protein EC957_005818 [Mortierella hygrophila]|uniref:Uncharacterized protein n=1 Tax=Mortierella hygrophila TaxID=979708 RepID=A0A9P6F0F8_9FUNG|nr:hypothetical protein EC957_005818 [Mortierella hygrophila]
MGSTASMPALPEDHYTSQYNVGTLDATGVIIVWLTVFRWILLVARADDINMLFYRPNPKRRGSSKQMPSLPGRVFGIVIVALFCLLLLGNSCSLEDAQYVMTGPSALKLTVLYPIFLAIFVTPLVKDHGQWILRPSTVVEYVMLVTRCVAGFGGVDILAAICSKIYRHIVPRS